MSASATIQDAVVGEVLPNIGRRRAGMRSDPVEKAVLHRLGTPRQRVARAMAGNAQRIPQSVVKRVRNGGTHSPKELRRQLDYITRDEAVKETWLNFNGTERGLFKNSVDTTVPLWTSGWAGNPKRGHSDHIILSFPKDTDAGAAGQIAREWGRAVFASGDFGDQWRYVAALHANTDHVHAHFVVDKRGIDHGQFLSISMKSELNYEVMRELHARIANEHGVPLNASSRLSRGIAEHPPREVEYRAAHDAQAGKGAEGVTVAVPAMSIVERMKREAIIRSFSKQYRAFSSIAAMASDEEGQGGFMERMRGLFEAASDTLVKGEPLVAAADTEAPAFDPSARLAHAQEQMGDAACEAWHDIQNMEPGPERVRLEVQFAEQTRAVRDAAVSDLFFEKHAETLAADKDPYRTALIGELDSAREHLGHDLDVSRTIEASLDDLRERFEAAFTVQQDRLADAGTSAGEMAERFLLANRTAGQIEAWREGGYDREFEGRLIAGDYLIQMRREYSDEGYDDDRIEMKLERHIEKALILADHTIRPEFISRYQALERELSDEAARITGGYEVPRDLQEIIARDQLLYGEQFQRLSDVPAIGAIVERMIQEMPDEDLQAVRAGDTAALREAIKDPAIRAAVGSELRNEGGLADARGRHSEPVEQFQRLAGQTGLAKPAVAQKSVETDLEDDYGL